MKALWPEAILWGVVVLLGLLTTGLVSSALKSWLGARAILKKHGATTMQALARRAEMLRFSLADDTRATPLGMRQFGPTEVRFAYSPFQDTALLYTYSQLAPEAWLHVCDHYGVKITFVRRHWSEIAESLGTESDDIHLAIGNLSSASQAIAAPVFLKPFLFIFQGHCIFARHRIVRDVLSLSKADLRARLEAHQDIPSLVLTDHELASILSKGRMTYESDTDLELVVRHMGKRLRCTGDLLRDVVIQPTNEGVGSLLRGDADLYSAGLVQASVLLAKHSEAVSCICPPERIGVESVNGLVCTREYVADNHNIVRIVARLWLDSVRWFKSLDRQTAPLYLNFLAQELRLPELANCAVLLSLMRRYERFFESHDEAIEYDEDRGVSRSYGALVKSYLYGGETRSREEEGTLGESEPNGVRTTKSRA